MTELIGEVKETDSNLNDCKRLPTQERTDLLIFWKVFSSIREGFAIRSSFKVFLNYFFTDATVIAWTKPKRPESLLFTSARFFCSYLHLTDVNPSSLSLIFPLEMLIQFQSSSNMVLTRCPFNFLHG